MHERTKRFLAGLFSFAMGLIPVLAAFDVIETDDDDFGAPRWFAAAVGFLFVLVGAWLGLTSTPERLGLGMLRVLSAPLLLALSAGFCAAVVTWPRRVHAGRHTRAAFLALAVFLAFLAARELWRAVLRPERRPRS